jgi:hypothetical protein
MLKTNRACDLCGLDIGLKPFFLQRVGKRLQFCCDACLGVYQMLHETESPTTPTTPNDTEPPTGET